LTENTNWNAQSVMLHSATLSWTAMPASAERNDDMSQSGAHADIWSQLQLLAVSGVAGGIFRAVFAPRQQWRRAIVQFFAGAVAAVFLGGAAAGLINAIVDVGPYALLAAGFLVGSGGEAAVRALQNKLFGPSDRG